MANATDKTSTKKPKLVRDSFTIPKNEFAAIEALKTRAIALGTSVKKSELLRAGLMALQGLDDAAYKAALSAVPTLKTGRPAAEQATSPQVASKRTRTKPEAKSVKKTAAGKPAAKAPVKSPAKPPVKAVAKAKVKPLAQAATRKPAARAAATRTKG